MEGWKRHFKERDELKKVLITPALDWAENHCREYSLAGNLAAAYIVCFNSITNIHQRMRGRQAHDLKPALSGLLDSMERLNKRIIPILGADEVNGYPNAMSQRVRSCLVGAGMEKFDQVRQLFLHSGVVGLYRIPGIGKKGAKEIVRFI